MYYIGSTTFCHTFVKAGNTNKCTVQKGFSFFFVSIQFGKNICMSMRSITYSYVVTSLQYKRPEVYFFLTEPSLSL